VFIHLLYMKIRKNLFKFGNSSGVIIDSIVRKSLNLKPGDSVWVTIKKDNEVRKK